MGRFYSGDIEGKFWFGIQSSGDASYFGVNFEEDINEETGKIDEGMINYSFKKKDISKVKEGIKDCEKSLGKYKKKIDLFFKNKYSYTDNELSIFLKKTEKEAKELLEFYARLELGNKILKCLNEKGRCYFSCEV